MPITKKCLQCQKEFKTLQKEINRGYGKFCSRTCSSRYNGAKKSSLKKPNVSCSWCGTKFYKNASKKKMSKSGLFFCKRECKDLAQRIGGIKEIQPPHYNKENRTDYRKTAFMLYPKKCNRCGYDEHEGILIVHHIDRNRENNSICNLEVLCPNCHDKEHFLSKDGRFHNMSSD